MDEGLPLELVDFLNEAWTPFHAVARVARELRNAGFVELDERKDWSQDIKKGGRYFFTRNHSSLVSFAVGSKFEPGNGFITIGTHTDSPCPKLKPVSKLNKSKHLMLGVQCYGGGLWTTWFDRDLTIAGRVVVRRPGGNFSHELVKVSRPICRIPMLAVHLARGTGTDFKLNTETDFAPVLATELKTALDNADGDFSESKGGSLTHHHLLLKLIGDELKCNVNDIADFELQLCDTQPPVIGGALKEFIFSGRLDNLASCFMAMRSLVDSTSDMDLVNETSVRMICMFDNEEVGSSSAHGACAPMIMDTIRRVTGVFSQETGVNERAVQSSFLISCDMAHAVHPNYSSKHESNHTPQFHKGMVIKYNANQRYATTAVTAFLFKELGAMAEGGGCPVQEFVVRNDCACGSTIGPIISGRTGLRTVDVGAPQVCFDSNYHFKFFSSTLTNSFSQKKNVYIFTQRSGQCIVVEK